MAGLDGSSWTWPDPLPCKTFSQKLEETRADFEASCHLMKDFAMRNFQSIGEREPKYASLCAELSKNNDLVKFNEDLTQGIGKLVNRVTGEERLRLAFIGHLSSGKSTLINMLLTYDVGFTQLLPAAQQAETQCIWKVESCDGSKAQVLVDEKPDKDWDINAAESRRTLADIAKHLKDRFSRVGLNNIAILNEKPEICLKLPLKLLDPFNSTEYSLVDTPGFNDDERFRNMVSTYLHDNSYMLCMVCSMQGASPQTQEVQSMVRAHQTRRSFWVLTHYDSVLQRLDGDDASEREAADRAFGSYTSRIEKETKCNVVFPHAANLLCRPNDAINEAKQQFLKLEEAKEWFNGIRTFVTAWFHENQPTVWLDQAQDAEMRANALVKTFEEYLHSSDGRDDIVGNFDAEMKTAVNKAMQVFKLEVTNALNEVICEENLKKLGQTADKQAVKDWTQYLQRSDYMDAVNRLIATKMQDQLLTRKRKNWEGACNYVQERAGDLFKASRDTSLGPESSDANMQYYVPGECAPFQAAGLLCGGLYIQSGMLTTDAAVTAVGYATGITLSVPAIACFAVVSTGLIFSAASQAHRSPIWTREEALGTVIKAILGQNPTNQLQHQWRTEMHLALDNLTAFLRQQYRLKLKRGSMTEEELFKICPDKWLVEQIKKRVAASSCRIKKRLELFHSPSLDGMTATNSLDVCSELYHQRRWKEIAESTKEYGKPCRADDIPSLVYADLLHLRTLALLRTECYQEAKETIEVFLDSFPDLILPEAYAIAVCVLPILPRAPDVGLKENPHSISLLQSRINASLKRMSQQGGATMPGLVEIWYLAIVASFQRLSKSSADQAKELLGKAITDFVQHRMTTQMKTNDLRDLVPSMVNSVQLLLEAVPPQFMATPCQTWLMVWVLEVVRNCFQRAKIEPDAYKDFRCQLYETNAVNVPEGWIITLCAVDRANPP